MRLPADIEPKPCDDEDSNDDHDDGDDSGMMTMTMRMWMIAWMATRIMMLLVAGAL